MSVEEGFNYQGFDVPGTFYEFQLFGLPCRSDVPYKKVQYANDFLKAMLDKIETEGREKRPIERIEVMAHYGAAALHSGGIMTSVEWTYMDKDLGAGTRKTTNEWAKNWDFILDVKDLWEANQDLDSDMDCYHLARNLVKRIRGSDFYGPYEDQAELEAICKEFERLEEWAEQPEFNEVLTHLYNWCDRGKRVWLKTAF